MRNNTDAVNIRHIETIEQFITRFSGEEPEAHPVTDTEFVGKIWRGSTLRVNIFGEFDGFCVGQALPTGFREIDEYCNGFRNVFVNDQLRVIVTYCEGDISVTLDDSDAAYQARLQSAAAFYARYN
jgi:hypothetical protein